MQYEILKMNERNHNNVMVERKEIEKYLNEVYDGSPIMCPLSYELNKTNSNGMITVMPEFVSHTITNLWIENDYLIAEVDVLDTDPGNVLSELINGTEDYHFVAWYQATTSQVDHDSPIYVTNIVSMSCFPAKASDVAFD